MLPDGATHDLYVCVAIRCCPAGYVDVGSYDCKPVPDSHYTIGWVDCSTATLIGDLLRLWCRCLWPLASLRVTGRCSDVDVTHSLPCSYVLRNAHGCLYLAIAPIVYADYTYHRPVCYPVPTFDLRLRTPYAHTPVVATFPFPLPVYVGFPVVVVVPRWYSLRNLRLLDICLFYVVEPVG